MLDSADDKSIEDVLDAAKLIVPKYQRPYQWRKVEAEEFWNDLYSYYEDRRDNSQNISNLFLGTFIFHATGEKKYEIVDGQQRITSIFILLIAIKIRLQFLDHDAAQVQINGIKDILRFVDKSGGGFTGTRFTPSPSIEQLFEEMVKDNWDGSFDQFKSKELRNQVKKIKRIYDYFVQEVSLIEAENFVYLLKTIYSTKIVQITINRIEDAFSIFERTNARGMDLEASDLLKNFLFSKLSNDSSANFETTWEKIHSKADGTTLRMIKYFYVSKKGYVSQSLLYRSIQKLDVTPKQLLDELEKFSNFYDVIRNSDLNDFKKYIQSIGLTELAKDTDKSFRVFSSIQGLRYMKITQVYPLIYSIIQAFVRNNLQQIDKYKKSLPLLFKNLESYHFINNLILDRVGNEVEKPYANFARDFANSTEANFNEILKKFYAFLKMKIASKEEFEARFIDLSYQDEYQKQLYVFDRIYNYANNKDGEVSATGYVEIFSPNTDLKNFDFTVEHWLPQKNKDTLVNKDLVDNIGNLLILTGKLNSSLGHKPPELKANLILENVDNEKEVSRIAYVKEFVKEFSASHSSWNDQSISTRASILAKHSYSKVWKFEPPL